MRGMQELGIRVICKRCGYALTSKTSRVVLSQEAET